MVLTFLLEVEKIEILLYLFFKCTLPNKAIKVIKMPSTIIHGVSHQLASEYLKSYNDSKVKYIFSVICEINNKKNKNFNTCCEADAYIKVLIHLEWFEPNNFYIQLNQAEEKKWRLTDDEILSLVIFETDDQLYEVFEIYAEKMKTSGRSSSQEEDEEEHADIGWIKWAQERQRLTF